MPWQKGQSGNPNGPKRKEDSVKAMFVALGGADGKAYADQLHRIATGAHDDVHARLKAIGIIANYVWGKPKERLEVTAPEGVTIKHVFQTENK